MAVRRNLGFSVSIDTEEDNWIPTLADISVRNVATLPGLADLFSALGVRATYFTTYQVAIDRDATAALKEVHGRGGAEIGAHLHPWNTPPYSGIERQRSMLRDYPADAQGSKLDVLLHSLRDGLHVRPTSFRTGRFGVGSTTIRALIERGILVDSSVTPLVSWREYDGASFIHAPTRPYRLDGTSGVSEPVEGGRLVEVPVTVGFTRFGPSSWPALASWTQGRGVRLFRLPGIASRTRFFRRVILSPETNSAEDMLNVSRRMVDGGEPHLHMYLHSSTLVPGLTPFTRTTADVQRVFDRVARYVEGLSKLADVHFCTVSEAADTYGHHSRGHSPREAMRESTDRPDAGAS